MTTSQYNGKNSQLKSLVVLSSQVCEIDDLIYAAQVLIISTQLGYLQQRKGMS